MKIFIQIASYRDSELIPTIENAIAQACYPNLLSFGVFWQGISKVDELPDVTKYPNFRMVTVDANASLGVCWARAQAQKLWQGEQYVLQIDSHMRFVQYWDAKMINMLEQCPSNQPLLTAYPPAYEPPNKILNNSADTLKAVSFYDSGMPKLGGGNRILSDHPVRGAFIAAGFIFASSSFIKDVPYDPQLYFQGEEINLAARAWTSGWDIFHPHEVVIYHYYNRENKPKHWKDVRSWEKLETLSKRRLRQLFGVENFGIDLGHYVLGNVRTLAQYEQFSGVDFKEQLIDFRDFQKINYAFK